MPLITIDLPPPQNEEVILLRQGLSIADDAILILFAGKFEPKKSPLLLLNAFLALNKPGVHLLFVGNGVLEDELKNNAVGKANVHFMDFQNQSSMPGIYQACDLFCLPSKGPAETWGLVVNEAMACGKAILAADKVGCAIDLVKNGENGMLFKGGDIDSLICSLQQLLNKEKLRDMGVYSRKIIKEWSMEVQVRNILFSLNEK